MNEKREPLVGQMVRIEVVDATNFNRVLPLISEYQRVSGVEPNSHLNEVFFRRFIERHEEGIQFLALDSEGEAIGFATLYWQNCTLAAGRACVLQDLFVAPALRGRGVARSLIAHASSYARCRGSRSLSWNAKFNDEPGQRVGDRLPARKSVFYSYRMSL